MGSRSDAQLEKWARALARNDGNIRQTARQLGIPRQTLQSARSDIHRWRARQQPQISDIELPEFPETDIPIDELLDHLENRSAARRKSFAAHTMFPVKIKEDKPIGILWFGDPHLDDNGNHLGLLRKHCQICKDTPGLYGANIGDTTNNWSGRLVKLYAEQDTSKKTAFRLAEWFMLSSGVTWLIWLIGNHDAWNDGAEILARMGSAHGTKKIICHDWEATFRLVFPNGWEPRVYAAHDFPGHSQWNPLHGPMKEGQMGVEANLYVCGHKHNSAEFSFENAARGVMQHFVRVRGYKFDDTYARRHGKHEQRTGSSIMTIFDPATETISRFMDIEMGAKVLTILRKE